MPKNVRRFAWLWLAANLAAFPALSLLPPPPPELTELGVTRPAEMVIGAAAIVIAAAITLPFFWLAVWRRRGWAKWVLLVSFLTDIPIVLADPLRFAPDHLPLTAFFFVSTLIEAVAFYFIFTGDARLWFRRQHAN